MSEGEKEFKLVRTLDPFTNKIDWTYLSGYLKDGYEVCDELTKERLKKKAPEHERKTYETDDLLLLSKEWNDDYLDDEFGRYRIFIIESETGIKNFQTKIDCLRKAKNRYFILDNYLKKHGIREKYEALIMDFYIDEQVIEPLVWATYENHAFDCSHNFKFSEEIGGEMPIRAVFGYLSASEKKARKSHLIKKDLISKVLELSESTIYDNEAFLTIHRLLDLIIERPPLAASSLNICHSGMFDRAVIEEQKKLIKSHNN